MKQEINIRKENPFDHNWVIELTEKAFETLEISETRVKRSKIRGNNVLL